jgi:hypothetical protein
MLEKTQFESSSKSFVKKNPTRKYAVGKVIGEYEVEDLLGRGLESHIKLLISCDCLCLFKIVWCRVFMSSCKNRRKKKAVKVFFKGDEKV